MLFYFLLDNLSLIQHPRPRPTSNLINSIELNACAISKSFVNSTKLQECLYSSIHLITLHRIVGARHNIHIYSIRKLFVTNKMRWFWRNGMVKEIKIVVNLYKYTFRMHPSCFLARNLCTNMHPL